MLAAYAPYANGGYYVRPTLLKQNKKPERKQIISKTIALEIQDILVKAVSEGTGKNAQIDGFEIAGKTSTAQKITSSGAYDGYIPGFIGFPVGSKKQFVVFVYIDSPKKSYYGNTVAAPIFQKIVKNILFRQKEYQNLARSYKDKKIRFDKINYQASSKRSYTKGYIPNLIGLDKATVENVMKSLGLDYSFSGFGVVKKQSPAPGEKASKGTKISVQFRAPQYE
jgi:cell division protein FtsI (penicillin-binding protein 3)